MVAMTMTLMSANPVAVVTQRERLAMRWGMGMKNLVSELKPNFRSANRSPQLSGDSGNALQKLARQMKERRDAKEAEATATKSE